jgi:hypothetical protein
MIYNSFIHADENATTDVFRSNVLQFVNDKETHPIVKYKGFILALLLVFAGLSILLLFNRDKLLGHSFWKHLFVPVSELKDKYFSMNKRGGGGGGGGGGGVDNDDDDVLFGYDYKYRNSESAIFREAIEGMATTTTKDGTATTKSGKFVGADTESAEKNKKTPCAKDCSEYVELKGKINDLSKYVNAVKDQTDEIKQTSEKIQELGKQIEDLNKSLSPGGQVNIQM